MVPPFALRIVSSDEEAARALGRLLVAPLAQRGARVRLEGAFVEDGPRNVVDIQVERAEVVGMVCHVGVADAAGARWLAPLELPDDAHAARDLVVGYLERWGFTAGAAPRVGPSVA